MPMPFEGVRRFLPLLESMLDRVALWVCQPHILASVLIASILPGILISNEVQPSPCGSREPESYTMPRPWGTTSAQSGDPGGEGGIRIRNPPD